MPSVIIWFPIPGPRLPARPIPTPRLVQHPKAYLQAEDGTRVVLPWAPREVDVGGDAVEWATLDRPGRKPLVRKSGDGLRTLSFTALFGHADHQEPIETELGRLRALAQSGQRVLVNLGVLERGWWRITGLSITTLLRQEGTNHVTRAEVSVSLVEAYDVRPKIGSTSTKPPAKPAPKPAPKPAYRYHTVRAGDTLWDLAVKYLRDGRRWREIAKLNGVRDPRKLRIGTKLKIPPK